MGESTSNSFGNDRAGGGICIGIGSCGATDWYDTLLLLLYTLVFIGDISLTLFNKNKKNEFYTDLLFWSYII